MEFPMKTVHWFCALVLIAFTAPAVSAQPEPPKPGPEHDIFKKLVGTWDTTMKAGGMEFKGTMTYKMELGGLWLGGSLESDLGGMKFHGKSLETYDKDKKKYLSVWADSMGTQPMLMEGTYDKDKKTMTMTGEAPGVDGKPAKWRGVSTMTDDDTITQIMYVGDAKEPMFTIVYKRKK
jgi:hypothetical protein